MEEATVLGTNRKGVDVIQIKVANAVFISSIIICIFLSFAGGAAAFLFLTTAAILLYVKIKLISKWKKQ